MDASSSTRLSWLQFTWEKFEEMIVYIVQDVFDEPSTQRYLKQGNKQQGIDIIALQQKNGKYLSIQCKKTANFGVAELKLAEKEFLQGSFAPTSDTFIIATSSDCQNDRSQKHHQQQALTFRTDHQIRYELWDITYIETALKKHYRLVAHYFGKEQADWHCFSLAPAVKAFDKINDYIPRSLLNIRDINENPFMRGESKVQTLQEILDEELMISKNICVLADPYEGKTSLLLQTAYELTTTHKSIMPLLVILKDTTLKPIAEILKDHYNAWESVGACNLVVMIDGLDEVAGDRFTEAITLIKDFIRSYPQVHFLYSCRKLFFFKYHLLTELNSFEYYQLQPISHYRLDEYLEQKLGTAKAQIYRRIRQMDLEELMRNPFYLIEMTKWFRDPHQSLPGSKIEVTERFIEESLKFSATRRLARGKVLDENRVIYKKTLQKFAFALQLSGLNAAPKDMIQELFGDRECELLQSSSIITINDQSWSFINAMFQEQLSAKQLLAFPAEQIISLICNGRIIRKVNIKWIQTVASYLSLLPENHADRATIMEFIRKDNIELLTLADHSKFNTEIRLEIVQEIFSRLIHENIRLLLVQDLDVAEFIGNDDKAILYLISLLRPDVTELIKALCCRIMHYLQLTDKQQRALLLAVNREMPSHQDHYYGKLLLQQASSYQLTSKKLLKEILRKLPRLNHHEFRGGIYKYLVATGQSEEYYQLGIDGLEILVQYNQGINHHGSEDSLEKFLLSTNTSSNLKRLYQLMATDSWFKFYHNHSSRTQEFCDQLVKLTTKLYAVDRSLIYHLVCFLVRADKKHVLKNFENLFAFFEITSTHDLGIQLYIQQKDGEGYHFNFGKLLSEKAEEILLWMHEDGEIQKKDLYSFRAGYYRTGKSEKGDKFQLLIEQVFGTETVSKSSLDTYAEIEQIKAKNDKIHLISRDAFEQALRGFFGYYKIKVLTNKQLNAYPTKKTKRTALESNHLMRFIRKCRDQDRNVSLENCLEKFHTPGLFEKWRIYLLRESSLVEKDIEFKNILEEYYKDELPGTSFENTLGRSSNEVWYYKSVLLAELWQNYLFPTTEDRLLDFTWVISGGINALSNNRANKRPSLAEALLEQFKDDPEKLGNRILFNLRNGIAHVGVETAHLELCKILKLGPAIPILLEKINQRKHARSDLSHMISIYIKLGGSPKQLIGFFGKEKPYEDYLYKELVRILIEPFPEVVIPALKKVVKSNDHGIEDRISAAQFLAQAGESSGFNFMIDHLAKQNEPALEIQSKFQIWKVDTKKALKKLDLVIHMIPDTSFHRNAFYRSPDRFIVELLNGLASKEEDDLVLVYKYLQNNFEKFKLQFPHTAGNFIWYAENAVEDFRKQNHHVLPLGEIKALIERHP
jgi:hypothetical protein